MLDLVCHFERAAFAKTEPTSIIFPIFSTLRLCKGIFEISDEIEVATIAIDETDDLRRLRRPLARSTSDNFAGKSILDVQATISGVNARQNRRSQVSHTL